MKIEDVVTQFHKYDVAIHNIQEELKHIRAAINELNATVYDRE